MSWICLGRGAWGIHPGHGAVLARSHCQQVPTPPEQTAPTPIPSAHFQPLPPHAEKHYIQAIEHYTRAIELNPNNAVFYSNRAITHTKLENFGSAIMDATTALEIDPKFIKVNDDALYGHLASGTEQHAARSAAYLRPKAYWGCTPHAACTLGMKAQPAAGIHLPNCISAQ